MKLSLWSSESSMLTQSRIFTSLVAIITALNVIGCSGGGGGGDPGIPPGPEPGPLPIPTLDDHGNNVPSATVIYPGEEITTGFYGTPGDIDYFKIPVVADQWYTISHGAHSMTDYMGSSTTYQLLDQTGSTSMAHTADWGWPEDATWYSSIGNRILWQAENNGNYIYTRRSYLNNTIGSYAFKVASSQLAISQPNYNTSNFRSDILIEEVVGGVTIERYNGSASGSTTASYINLLAFGGNQVGISASTSEVYFNDDDGVQNAAPENNVWHIHQGYPYSLNGDGIDDAVQFGLFDPNINIQLSDDPHPFIEEVAVGVTLQNLPLDLLHLLLETPWYIDAHITDNYELYDVPIVSSLANGGVNMFDSDLLLNGFEFPAGEATDSPNLLEVVYDDEYQIFYLPYGDKYDHSSLVGATVHLHAGGPNVVSEVPLINLGTVPAPEDRPLYESGGEYILHADNTDPDVEYNTDLDIEFPGVETVLYTLSDAEAQLLADATYTTGWYIDLHTGGPNSDPELRADAILYGFVNSSLEVGISRNTNPGFLRSADDGGVRIARGNVSFVADDTTFGPISVKLNGKDLGQIDLAQVEGEVECGEDTPGQSVSKTLKVNTYPYVAYADGVSWSGTVTLEDGGCTTVVLNAEDAVALD